ncbi:MAG TPA: hypothetical protein VIT92_11140 [Burkholderiaceae bacterium]
MKRLLLTALAALTSVSASGADECAALNQRFVAAKASAAEFAGMATCAARAGDKDAALTHLAAAARRGYRNAAALKDNRDFAALRNDPRWQRSVAAIEKAEAAYKASINRELAELFEADQADRRPAKVDWAVVEPRDRTRHARVKELAAAGAMKHSADFYHAAMIFQHGSKPEDYKQAQLWALRAVDLDPNNDGARWLAAAAEDRYLHTTGKPQVWGTQYVKPQTARLFTMEPFDRSKKTDAQRIAMKVPTLAESQAKLAQMNAGGK